ncbi:MAG: SLC13 family permease [Prevotella sp.]|nr:SLC13 family permease [Prevotella sp.]
MDTFMFLGFNIYAWITIVTVLTMFTVLLLTKLRTDLVFLGAIAVLYVTGVLDAKEAFSGFSSTSVVVIGVLFIVVAGLMHTGVLQWIVKNLLGQPNTYSKAVIRLMLPVAALSSFLSNTTVVALFVNIVKMWSKKLNISPSKLLIPLSYASGMGGVCTLIGTPPNLIISGLYAEKTGTAMNILTTTIPGLFCLCVGVLSIIAMRKLLPDRKAPDSAFESTGEYTVELRVPSDNPYIGKTLSEAGLYHVNGGSLIEMYHFDDIQTPISEDEPIMGGDHLVYAGQIDELIEMADSHQLVAADHHVFTMSELDMNVQIRTAYVNFGSSLIGKTMIGSSFEKNNNLMLAAVARRGERINEAPRQVVLQAGDTLLFLCPKNVKINTSSLTRDLHFFDSDDVPNIGSGTLISTTIMILMVLLSALSVMPLLQCAFLAAIAMLAFRCCTPEQAMKSINGEILMVFAGSVVLGLAIQKTGIAERLAFGILDVCGSNPLVVMTAICFVGTFITEFISNTAAGAMFFPIMYEAAEKLGYEPFPFLVALMISVSSSFATPIGSPTHMLVYGPGGYRFSDFMRIGLLMNIIILAANILIVNIIYPLTPLP